MQVQNKHSDDKEHDDRRDEDEHHRGARVNKDIDIPLVAVGGRGEDDQLRVRDDGGPAVGPLGLLVDPDAEVLDIMVDLPEPEMNEGQTELVVAAVGVLGFCLADSKRS